MITYIKLPLTKEKTILKQSDWVTDEVFVETEVQYYKISKTEEVIEEDTTTIENFENIILALQEKKNQFVLDIDEKIKKNQDIIDELRKL